MRKNKEKAQGPWKLGSSIITWTQKSFLFTISEMHTFETPEWPLLAPSFFLPHPHLPQKQGSSPKGELISTLTQESLVNEKLR